jgi:hypothetical protein
MTALEMLYASRALYRSHFRLLATTAIMVSGLQALELVNAPPAAAPLVFIAAWPIIVGVMSRALSTAWDGRPLGSARAVYESIGWKTFLLLIAANLIIVVINAAGLALLVVPGLYLWVRYQFVPQAIVVEHAGLGQAFRRSSELVQGSWWRVLGIDIAIFGAASVLNLVTFLVLTLPGASLERIGLPPGAAILVGMSALWSLMDPIVFGVMLLLYYDLRLRHSPSAMPALARQPA